MKPSTVKIFELFMASKRYRVPLFQRQYVWGQELQWQPLWEDITRKADERLVRPPNAHDQPRNHFLGAVVLNQIKEPFQNIYETEIIDGQQRLTTLQIMLLALKDYAIAGGYPQYKIRLEGATENPRVEGDEIYKVWPTNADRPYFKSVFKAGSPQALEDEYPLRKKKRSRYFEPRARLVEAYLFFYNAIAAYVETGKHEPDESAADGVSNVTPAQRIDALVLAITEHLVVVQIELEDGDDPQVIFETLNFGGVELLPSDLIRNFVFLEATHNRENVQKLHENYWSDYDERDGDFWRKKVSQGRLNRPRLDLFFFHFLTYRTREDILITQLFREFKQWWGAGRSTEAGLQLMNHNSAIFKRLLAPEGNTRIDQFARRLIALDTSTMYPLLLFLLAEKGAVIPQQELQGIAADLESFLVRRAVCDLTPKNYNRLFLGWLKKLHSAGSVDRAAIKALLLESPAETARWPSDDEFRQAWLAKPVYKLIGRQVKMILLALDRQMMSKMQETVHIEPEVLNIEHVMPQSRKAGEWPYPEAPLDAGLSEQALEERRLELVHTFGNLTLVTSAFNSKLSNRPFKDKRSAIVDEALLKMNHYFNKKADEGQWNEDDIQKRGEALFELALQIWPRPAQP